MVFPPSATAVAGSGPQSSIFSDTDTGPFYGYNKNNSSVPASSSISYQHYQHLVSPTGLTNSIPRKKAGGIHRRGRGLGGPVKTVTGTQLCGPSSGSNNPVGTSASGGGVGGFGWNRQNKSKNKNNILGSHNGGLKNNSSYQTAHHHQQQQQHQPSLKKQQQQQGYYPSLSTVTSRTTTSDTKERKNTPTTNSVGDSTSSTVPSMLSAEIFPIAQDDGEEPIVRRRGHTHWRNFTEVDETSITNSDELRQQPQLQQHQGNTNSKNSSNPDNSNSGLPSIMGLGSHLAMCGNIPALTFPTALNGTAGLLQANTACVQRVGPAASTAAGTARKGITEFAIVAAEVYRQECKSDNRGGDEDFFVDANSHNSIVKTSDHQNDSFTDGSLQSSEQRDNRNEVSSYPSAGLGRSRSSPDLNRPSATSAVVGDSGDIIISVSSPSDRRVDTPPPRMDQMFGPNQGFRRSQSPTDKGVPKEVTTQSHQGDDYEEEDDDVDDDANMRNARMDLFRNRESDTNGPESKLARALEDMDRQDAFIQSLKKQMEMTQKSLDETSKELDQVKADSKEKQFKSTEIRAKAVHEKKRLEDLYEKEVQKSKKLQEAVSHLHFEVSTLKVSLRTARSGKNNNDTSTTNSPGSLSPNNAQVISLKAEIVDLRSQLAEARATIIDDTSSRHAVAGADELKKRLSKAESDLTDLRQRNRQALQEREHAEQMELDLKQKLDAMEAYSKQTQARLEENLMIAMKSADDVRAELVKTKANLQRLERERSRARLNSSADVERVNKELSSAREDSAKLKQELAEAKSRSATDREELMKELDELREKLHSTNQETLSKSSERIREQRRLHTEVSRSAIESSSLKEQLKAKDDELEARSSRIAKLEQDIAALTQRLEEREESSKETVSRLQQDLKSIRFKEQSLSMEMKLQKALLDEARSNARSQEVQSFLSSLNDGYIDHLRKTLDKLPTESLLNMEGGEVGLPPDTVARDAERQKEIEETLKIEIGLLKMRMVDSGNRSAGAGYSRMKFDARLEAMEQAFLNDVTVLKSKLAEAQSKILEETYRTQEERRINRESEAERLLDLERLRQEKNEALEANRRLESELLELRRRGLQQQPPLLSLSKEETVVPVLEPITPTSQLTDDSMNVPNNVKRLRNELAQARERLAAARESSRVSPLSVSTTREQLHTSNSHHRGMEPPTPSPESPDNSTLSEESHHSVRSTWAPPSDFINRQASGIPTMPARALFTTSSPAPTQTRSKKPSLDDLTRQLQASRKRLQSADKRLNGLVAEGALLKIIRNKGEDSVCDGSIDEVVNTDDGSIEVNHRRFADI